MIERLVLISQIQKSLQQFPIVGLLGPRQVGKTTLAKKLIAIQPSALYLDLERPSDYAKLQEAELYLHQHQDKLVVIDEVQRLPTLFPLLRSLVDEQKRPGQFLLLGSANPIFLQHTAETLAGRIDYVDIHPFNTCEVENSRNLWLRGGFPLSFLANSDALAFDWIEAYIRTYLEQDIPNLGIRVPAPQLRQFWQMLAHYHGQIFNSSQLANNLSLSPQTVKRYLAILENTFLVRQLPPWHVNIKKRLVKSPKIYLRDSGILHALLGITNEEQLLSRPNVGASYEGWVIEQVLQQLPRQVQAFFYRTHAGAEMDLVLTEGGTPKIGFEIKRSLTPKPTAGLYQSMKDLGLNKAFVIYPGTEVYPLSPKITAIPLMEVRNSLLQCN